MSKAERGYIVFTGVDANGIAQTGLTALINDRNTTLVVPWEVPEDHRGNNKAIEWLIDSEDGKTYKVTVRVNISVSGGKTTTAYTKGSYTIAEVS
jgi:predicted HAD superfamily phosphohydrolase YqeG